MKYRIYEAVNNTGKEFLDLFTFDDFFEAELCAKKLHSKNQESTFIIEFEHEPGCKARAYFGTWRDLTNN